MTDRPILFSAPMIRALLEGRKTQTRRLLKRPSWAQEAGWPEMVMNEQDLAGRLFWYAEKTGCLSLLPVPQPRDRLWAREAHALVGNVDPGFLMFRANGYTAECARIGFDKPYPPESEVRWRPSIHMPRWASRITLIVTDVRVQRLQDISAADAIAEGIACEGLSGLQGCGELWRDYKNPPTKYTGGHADNGTFRNPRNSFRSLWNSLHGDGAWDENPWVSATTFSVHNCNIDQMRASND